ncbi:succinyl-CoA synthetase-like protein [Biscogniauxia sp. FL1348]|nr:succinyl-CoA synthetase-like protein [Biscogniauxia sp. FL1348]
MLRRAAQVGPRKGLPRQGTYRDTVVASRGFGNTAVLCGRPYDSTLQNLKIGSHTRATANAKESLDWGTNIVGGVTPGREGEHLGLPVLPTVRKAMEVLKPDATGIYVAAHQATGAIEEAIEAEVPLIVAVAEHIPLHDMLRIHSMLKTQSVSRLVGANSPGIISSVGKCRIGFQPLPCFEPGKIGIVARSGTLSYETAASTLRAGLGQSMCIGVGGDILPGTTLREGLQILAEDSVTEGIALIGEVGGHAEIEAADWIKEYRAATNNPKPIVALVAGVCAVPGRIMGHAGAFSLPGEPSALTKAQALEAAGATIINHPSRFGSALKTALSSRQPPHRRIHTAVRRPSSSTATASLPRATSRTLLAIQQTRSLYITRNTALDLLRQRGLPIADEPTISDLERRGLPLPLLGVTVNRSTNCPCIIASPSSLPDAAGGLNPLHLAKFDIDYTTATTPTGTGNLPISAIATSLGLPASAHAALAHILAPLVALFIEKEAFLIETQIVPQSEALRVASARLGFDDAAFRSGGRHADIHRRHDASPGQEEGESNNNNGGDGIVYVKLHETDDEEGASIGTLVNGAGLAMNTVDALADAGGRAANFLDTGGKATSETVKRSFEMVLRDPRVKCVFVNIFGGLTLGDMIARGVVLAFRDLDVRVPVVVRIRGTNEKEGQRVIAGSRLPLYAFDDFDQAAAKAIELAREGEAR